MRSIIQVAAVSPLTLIQKFSLQQQCDIKDTSYENKEKFQLGDYLLIQYQIFQITIMRVAWKTESGATNEILQMKGLIRSISWLKLVGCPSPFLMVDKSGFCNH